MTRRPDEGRLAVRAHLALPSVKFIRGELPLLDKSIMNKMSKLRQPGIWLVELTNLETETPSPTTPRSVAAACSQTALRRVDRHRHTMDSHYNNPFAKAPNWNGRTRNPSSGPAETRIVSEGTLTERGYARRSETHTGSYNGRNDGQYHNGQPRPQRAEGQQRVSCSLTTESHENSV